MTRTESGVDKFVLDIGFAAVADFVSGLALELEGFSLSQSHTKAAMPMRMTMEKNLFPGLFCLGAVENCLRNGTSDFKYKNQF